MPIKKDSDVKTTTAKPNKGIKGAFDTDAKSAAKETQKQETTETGFKRISVSIPKPLLAKIDAHIDTAKKNGETINRSSYLANAALEKITGESE